MKTNITGGLQTFYRSPGLPSGTFRNLDVIHVHIDGGGTYDWVLDLVRELERRGNPGKLNAVSKSIAGPQRSQQPDTYRSHTPGSDKEELDYFSTSLLADRETAISVLNRLLPVLARHPGGVIEVERVVASVEGEEWRVAGFDDVLPIGAAEVGYKPNFTLDFEIHHGIDLAAQHETITLDDLLENTSRRGIVVGGWFKFERQPGVVSYRSNSFWRGEGLIDRVQSERSALANYLTTRASNCQFWTIVERILGIWRAPLKPIDATRLGK